MDLKQEIRKLLKEKNAVLLAHNYQIDDIQEIADFTGDSLGLSIEASRVKEDIIVFAGVHFMAETAYMLSPNKKVLLPEIDAGCPMADMVTAEELREFKAKYPGVPVVCYVNSSAEVKAESDICCTSANAVNVVKSIDSDRVIFVPDRNLGHYVSRFVDKEIILWNGFCPIHERVTRRDLEMLKSEHPDAIVVLHPECPPDVIELADHVCSTSGVYTFCKESKHKKFIIGTERGVGYRLRKENPDKEFYFAYSPFQCKNMKKTTLKKVYDSLVEEKYEIKVEEDIRKKAVLSIERMLQVPRNY
ncbi:quinolinate synthase NadA [Deferribacteraceae bacterium V6Fe1]|uniref:quinolinate synthase NadA n=1 Tax=Deferrivibrio essentukiensis TaxID=2880922 RepID=UPI001F6090A9|nr:quinolinate synthase NadA [Deferrivibrio essentukiensis]MBZ4672806.1 nadA [Deferribacteraceae bacterium]MCB4204709.1 quinolinate synthase NadA [Deferrivibrio essentukiensis]UOD34063.1 quinolinate synthase NadA [Deferribacteraceae bacterium V6Fe1]